jgi:hypothetical protein
VDNFRSKLHDYLPVDDNASFDEIAQQIIDQVTKEREDFIEKYGALERANNDRQSNDNIESVRQSYMNTVYDLNQKLLAMKEAYDQLDVEKQVLASELEKQSAQLDQTQVARTTGKLSSSYTRLQYIVFFVSEKMPSDIWREPFREVCVALFYCLIIRSSIRFRFTRAVLMQNNERKRFSNFERALPPSLLNVLNWMQLIELGNYTNRHNWITSEPNYTIM